MRTSHQSAAHQSPRPLTEMARHWPMAKGSLAEVRMRCIRPNCRACSNGRKHPVFLFSFTEQGRRRCMYVPRDLVPALRQALANGRWMEGEMRRTGVRLIKEHRRQRTVKPARQGGGGS